jgi:hypothetical protein
MADNITIDHNSLHFVQKLPISWFKHLVAFQIWVISTTLALKTIKNTPQGAIILNQHENILSINFKLRGYSGYSTKQGSK